VGDLVAVSAGAGRARGCAMQRHGIVMFRSAAADNREVVPPNNAVRGWSASLRGILVWNRSNRLAHRAPPPVRDGRARACPPSGLHPRHCRSSCKPSGPETASTRRGSGANGLTHSCCDPPKGKVGLRTLRSVWSGNRADKRAQAGSENTGRTRPRPSCLPSTCHGSVAVDRARHVDRRRQVDVDRSIRDVPLTPG